MKALMRDGKWKCYMNYNGEQLEAVAPTYLEALDELFKQLPEGVSLCK